MTLNGFKSTLLFGVLCLLGANAFALNCDDPQSNAEEGQCAILRFNKSTAAIDAVYKKIISGLDTDIAKAKADGDDVFLNSASNNKKLLITAQRSWVQFRIDHCTSTTWNEWAGGSGQTVTFYGCQTEMTKARMKELSATFADKR